eukprot:tig00020944_g16358.t1
MPPNAYTSDYQTSVVVLAASGFPSPSAGYTLASEIYDISATSLDNNGNVVDIKSFPANITFELPTTGSATVAQNSKVMLAFYNSNTKTWDTSCGPASNLGSGIFSGQCNHLTPFAFVSTASAGTIGGSSVPYWPGIASGSVPSLHAGLSSIALSLSALAIVALASKRTW